MGKETKDIENDAVMPDVSKEVANADPSYSGSNNVQKDDQQANVQDDKIANDSKSEEVKTEDDRAGQEKVLKKPDKILPCPRCNSMDTKFCYYNNYNVNQPRHFCKNCQRYWTAGGTMRNVPVGAGRRKNKHASHYRHIMMPSDDMVASRGDISDLMHHQALPSGTSVPVGPLKGNETLLKFGPEAPLCDSMATVLNIAEQKKNADFASVGCGDNREEQSCESSVVASSNRSENGLPDNAFNNDQNGMPGYCNGLTLPHVQCYSAGAALMLPWSPGWNNVAAMTAARCSSELVHGSENGNPNPLSWTCPSMMATPGFCAPAVPFPVVPPSFWGCMPGWPNGMWGAPWPGCNGTVLPSSPTSNSSCSGNGSPTLGKHSRDTSMQAEEKMEKNLWVPKTLRIDDPDEAAKSSIWATLGIKPDEKGIFKPFQSNGHKNGQTSESAQVLHANPAAFSRSQSFQEGT